MQIIKTFTGFPSEIEVQIEEFLKRHWDVVQLAIIDTKHDLHAPKILVLAVFERDFKGIYPNEVGWFIQECRYPNCKGKECNNFDVCKIRQTLEGLDEETAQG